MTGNLLLPMQLLAVAGGAAVGWLAIGFAVNVLRRFLGVSSVPRPPLVFARTFGAVVAGWVVWLWVFGHGGSGIGGPGGNSLGGAPGSEPGITQEQPRPTPARSVDGSSPLTVVMLGGNRVKDDRFYKILGENQALTLSELKEALKKRQDLDLQRLKIAIYDDSVAENHVRVTNLVEWAEQHNLQVSKSRLKGEAP
jgi:hypothetical protein